VSRGAVGPTAGVTRAPSVAQLSDRYDNEHVARSSSFAGVALALALLAAALLLVVPTGSYVRAEEQIGEGGERTREVEQGRTRLLEKEGAAVVLALLVPVVIAFVPVALRRTRVARAAVVGAALLLLAFVFLTGFSIGLLFAPSALAMVVAAFAPHKRTQSARA
jgi:cytochrome b